MVGPCGLEPQTSTVSTYHRSQRQQLRPYRAYSLRSVIPLSQARITGRDRRYRKATATSRIPPWFASGLDVGVGVFPEGEEPLLRQADAAQEVLKARVGTQAVEPGINSKHDHAVRSVFHGFIEPAEGPVRLGNGLLVPSHSRQTPRVDVISVGVARVQLGGALKLLLGGYSIPVEIDTYET